jgi:HK97 family phage major capsid protein
MSNEKSFTLRKRAGEFHADAQLIADEANRAGREMTDREVETIRGLTSKGAAAIQEAEALEGLEAQARYLAAPRPRRTGPHNPRAMTNMAPGALVGGLGALGAFGAPVVGGHEPTVNWLAALARNGVRNAITDATMSTALTIGSNPDGGYEVPPQLDNELQIVAANYSPLLKLCKSVVGVTDGYVQNVATTLPAAAWVAEGATRSNTTTPNLAQIVFTRGGVYAAVQASQWLLQDNTHDLYSFIISELGRQFGAQIGTAATGGTGTNQPKGLLSQTLAATADGTRAFGTVEYIPTGGATQAPSIDNCITALSHLHPSYQQGAAWLMSQSAAAALMTSKASTAGSYLWQPDMSAAQPPTLLGLPVFIDPTLPAATTANAYSIWLGNWPRAYTVVRYGRPIMVRDDVTNKGQIILYSEQRVGGNVTDTSALKAIKTAVS